MRECLPGCIWWVLAQGADNIGEGDIKKASVGWLGEERGLTADVQVVNQMNRTTGEFFARNTDGFWEVGVDG